MKYASLKSSVSQKDNENVLQWAWNLEELRYLLKFKTK